MAKFKNHYETLSLSPKADLDQIKAAFRKLARQHHPDLNANNPQAEEKFKEINEAYDVLSDPDKRRRFDHTLTLLNARQKAQVGPKPAPQAESPKKSSEPQAKETQASKASADNKNNNSSSNNNNNSSSSSSRPIQDLMDSFLGWQTKTPANNEAQNASNAKQAKQSTQSNDRFTEQQKPSTSSTKQTPQAGQDLTLETEVTPEEAAQGTVKTLHIQHRDVCRMCAGTGKLQGFVCTTCHGERFLLRHKRMDVRIPAGVKNGSKVRLAGEGSKGLYGGANGDLYLLIKLLSVAAGGSSSSSDAASKTVSIKGFEVKGPEVKGLHVYYQLLLPIPQIMLGCEVDMPTLNGRVSMTIPPLTPPGKVFRLKGQGKVSPRANEDPGDQFVTLELLWPERLNQAEKALYQKLQQLHEQPPQAK